MFCKLLICEWQLHFDVTGVTDTQVPYNSLRNRFSIFERYVSCDNQILEILKRNNLVTVFHNMHFVGEYTLDYGDLIGNEILIRYLKCNNDEVLLVIFNGEAKYYYKDYVSLEDNEKFYQYELIISECNSPVERLLLRFLKNKSRMFISFTDKELVINGLIHYRKHNGKYYSSASAVAVIKDDEIYINNLAFKKKNKCDFDVGMIENVVRI